MPLNDNQRKFIALYRSTTPRNATRAYEAVYKSRGKAASDNAARLIGLDSIRAEIDRLDAEELRDLGITAAAVLQGIARNAFSDVRQLFDATGAMTPVHQLPDDIAMAVSGIDVTETMLPGPDSEPVLQRTRKVRLWSKIESQKLLAQYLKLLVEQVNVTHSGEVLHTWQERLQVAHSALEERRNGHAHAP